LLIRSLWTVMHLNSYEPIWKPNSINPFHQSACLYKYPTIVDRKQTNKQTPWSEYASVSAATNTQAKIEEFLDATFMCGH
jgi:hypothetical protein